MWFKLEARGLELYVGVERLGELKIHEEIVPELLRELVQDIRSSGEVKDPVIADPSTGVILDGMHRVAALRELGCRYIPACMVDYRSPKIGVGCWYRIIKGRAEEKLPEICGLPGLEVQLSSMKDALRALEERKATAALLTARDCHLIRALKTDIQESYMWIKRLERILREEGFNVGYECEFHAEQLVRSGEVLAALLVPRVRKEEVLEAARSGRVFAHKTTRHVLPARPMNIRVPLKWLAGDRPLEEINRLLVESLSERKLERLEKGSFFKGRCYDEELLVFR